MNKHSVTEQEWWDTMLRRVNECPGISFGQLRKIEPMFGDVLNFGIVRNIDEWKARVTVVEDPSMDPDSRTLFPLRRDQSHQVEDE